MSESFDMEAARRSFQERSEARRKKRYDLWKQANDEANRAIRTIVEEFNPERVIQWGSVLRPELFGEHSDVDLAIEGITDMEEWSRLERTLEQQLSFSLDLLRWEAVRPEFRSQILLRGRVVYERS